MNTQFTRISEAVASWSDIRQLLRAGESGKLTPVVIPKDTRGFAWVGLLLVGVYLIVSAVFVDNIFRFGIGGFGLLLLIIALLIWWRGSIIEIEQGTTGVRSRWGAITGVLNPGRHYLWAPWNKVDAVVDTSTEMPYSAPITASPTAENVPVKSIEFFLKFRIVDPVAFVRTLGAGNFDLVLSSAVQDAIRQRSRLVRTERAYDLRGSDVGDMQQMLNRQLERYGVQLTGSNIPDVQLPDQYQQHLATRERVAKEASAYEREWELARKRRIDTLLMDIERAKKTRDARIVEVRAAHNKAREDVARMLEEHETEAQRVKWEIETKGRAQLTAAGNEAKAMRRLAESYRDNRAMLHYDLAQRRIDVGATLAESAPTPVVIKMAGGTGDSSALSTLMLAQMLPQITNGRRPSLPIPEVGNDQAGNDGGEA